MSSALGTDGIVDGNHECGLSNNANIRLWLNQVQNDILGRRCSDCMKIGWNEALTELTKRQTCRVSNKDVSVETDFSYYEKRPVCQEDALKILFGDEVIALVKGGQLEQPFALLFMWGYYLTMEGCHLDWAKRSTEKYIEDENYQVKLDDGCAGGKSMKVHGWYRIASKIAVNSYHTKLRNHQKKTWGWTFEITIRVNDEKVTAENSVYEVVVVGEHLPKRVISDMSRVDGTKFVIRRCLGESLSNDERLQ